MPVPSQSRVKAVNPNSGSVRSQSPPSMKTLGREVHARLAPSPWDTEIG